MPALLFSCKCGGVTPDTGILQRASLCLPCYGDKHSPLLDCLEIFTQSISNLFRGKFYYILFSGIFFRFFFSSGWDPTFLKWTCSAENNDSQTRPTSKMKENGDNFLLQTKNNLENYLSFMPVNTWSSILCWMCRLW